MSDDQGIMYDLLKELKEDFKDHRENFKTHSLETHNKMTNIEDDIKEIKDDSKKDRERIEKLEAPGKALGMVRKWAGWILTVGGAIAWIVSEL